MVNYLALEDQFKKSELQTASLLTCGFDPVAFSNIEPYVDSDIVELAKKLMKFKVHLTPKGSTFRQTLDKLDALENSQVSYEGKAGKPFSWSGIHLNQSDSFFGEIDKPVAVNEMDYVIKGNHNLHTLNPLFQETVNALGEEEAFVTSPDFDVKDLANKGGVRKVSNGVIHLVGGIKLPIVVVY